MGSFRLFLAIFVAISHMGVSISGYNPGILAVISFLIISGLVMTALIDKNYSAKSSIASFYLDRALRLYPQFLFYFVISCIIIATLLSETHLAKSLSAWNIIPSLAIAPLGLYMYGITTMDIVPPAWSLGLEVFFYATIPILILYKKRMPAFLISAFVFILSCTNVIDGELHGYRLITGTLFIFLCGSYAFRPGKHGKTLLAFVMLMSAALYVMIQAGVIAKNVCNAETTLGILLGLPTVYLLSKIKSNKIDNLLGNISYGVFLNHFVIIYLLNAQGIFSLSGWLIFSVMVASIILGLISYYAIEKPAIQLRRRLRYSAQQTQHRDSAATSND